VVYPHPLPVNGIPSPATCECTLARKFHERSGRTIASLCELRTRRSGGGRHACDHPQALSAAIHWLPLGVTRSRPSHANVLGRGGSAPKRARMCACVSQGEVGVHACAGACVESTLPTSVLDGTSSSGMCTCTRSAAQPRCVARALPGFASAMHARIGRRARSRIVSTFNGALRAGAVCAGRQS
jgi:hypothetical protein